MVAMQRDQTNFLTQWALDLLSKARVYHKVVATAANGKPTNAFSKLSCSTPGFAIHPWVYRYTRSIPFQKLRGSMVGKSLNS